MSYDVIASQPIVIDNGSGIVKAGFAGEEYPKVHFPSYIGRPKHVRVMAGGLEGDQFIGPKAEEHRGLLNIRYPIEHGIVTDWNDMEQIWRFVYSKEQLKAASEDHPVLLTEAPLNPRRNRQKAAEIFFETFNVPALYISMQAVLSLYATGRTTGVVLDSGDGVTHAVPIYEGFALPHSIMRSDVAGRDITRHLQLLLRREGHIFKTSSEFEIVRQMKESVCHVTLQPQKDEQIDTEVLSYKLPDGSTIQVGRARFRAPELLFHPHLIGEESEGIHEVLAYSIQKSDLDLRKILYSNIVLSGGSTLFRGNQLAGRGWSASFPGYEGGKGSAHFLPLWPGNKAAESPGFGDRLLAEIKKLTPKDIKIRISAPQDRLYSTWMGGSILAALDTFKKMWVSKQEYDENGQRAIDQKTF